MVNNDAYPVSSVIALNFICSQWSAPVNDWWCCRSSFTMKWTNVLVFIWQVTCSSMCSNHLSICVLTLVITCFLPYNATRNGVTAIRLSRRHVEFVATTTSLPGVYNIVTSLLHRRDNVSNNFISDDTQSSNNGKQTFIRSRWLLLLLLLLHMQLSLFWSILSTQFNLLDYFFLYYFSFNNCKRPWDNLMRLCSLPIRMNCNVNKCQWLSFHPLSLSLSLETIYTFILASTSQYFLFSLFSLIRSLCSSIFYSLHMSTHTLDHRERE